MRRKFNNIRQHGWPALFLPADYEDNPKTQIIFHKRMMRVWEVFGPIMAVIYLSSLFLPQWAIIIIGFVGFVTNQISFYANWSTDFDGLSAAQASDKMEITQDTVGDVLEDTSQLTANPPENY